ncbi:MAG: aminotransferase class IV [Deltaproteobacteria bacterium]|nr:aminotransferase class IV [Deltaproteobacteria bacterium]
MKPFVSINSRLIPLQKARISVLNAGYLYGEGLFETLLAVEGKVLFFEKHLERLLNGTKALQITLPMSGPKIKQEILRLLKTNKLSKKVAYVRLCLSADEEQVGSRNRSNSALKRRKTTLVIFAIPFHPFSPEFFKKGGRLILIRSTRNDDFPVVGVKSTNYLTRMMARREILKRGAVEGLLMNQSGRLTEGASSNFFLVKKGVLITPPLSEGLLPGVTRDVIIRLAKKIKIPFQEKPVTIKDLRNADEIFVTSTLKGVMPIRNFEGANKKPGEISATLMSAYESSWSRSP